jgi:hypothetical protein
MTIDVVGLQILQEGRTKWTLIDGQVMNAWYKMPPIIALPVGFERPVLVIWTGTQSLVVLGLEQERSHVQFSDGIARIHQR